MTAPTTTDKTFAGDLIRTGMDRDNVVRVICTFFGVGDSVFPIGELIAPERRDALLAANFATIRAVFGE